MYLVTFVDLCRSLNMPQLCVFVIVSKLKITAIAATAAHIYWRLGRLRPF